MKTENQLPLRKRHLRVIADKRTKREDEVRDEIYRMIAFLNKIDDHRYDDVHHAGYNYLKSA